MNKKISSFGLAAMMLLFSGNVMATDYYLSANGNDANDGKTAATAWATLAKVGSSAFKAGDHIYVSGIIKVETEVAKARLVDVVIEGTNPQTDGFDAEGKSSILHSNLSVVTFKNLSFKNGYRASDITENGAAAIYATHSRLTFENCIFEGNKCEQTNANACAGAVFETGANPENRPGIGGIFATNCKFINNTSKAGGGAMTAVSNTVDLKNCYFQNNEAANTGGAIYFNSINDVTIDGCAFEGNTAEQRGGAVFLFMNNLTDKVYTISNSTFYHNQAKSDGGAFGVSGNSNNTINLVHCTINGNNTLGGVDNAGGVNVKDKPGIVNVVNSIIQGNTATGNSNLFADVTFATTKVNFVNSYVGAVREYDKYASNYTTTSLCVLNNLPNSNQQDKLDLGTYKENAHIIPLKDGSNATKAADLNASKEYDVTTDQLGRTWEKPYIGAVQLTETEFTTGISAIKTNAPKSLKGIYNVAGQYVGNDASKLAKGLYIINGKKVVVK